MHYSFTKGLSVTAMTAFLLVGCQGGSQTGKQTEAEPDTLLSTETVVTNDTLRGYIGEDTSMNLIQLITDDGETLELELSDDTERNATLEVGNHVFVVVRAEADSSLTVLATADDPLPLEGNSAAIR